MGNKSPFERDRESLLGTYSCLVEDYVPAHDALESIAREPHDGLCDCRETARDIRSWAVGEILLSLAAPLR